MGCTSSNTVQQNELATLVKKQTMQIETLQQTNQELRKVLEGLVEENQKVKPSSASESLQQKIAQLEAKIKEFESKLASSPVQSDDTFKRDSEEEETPAILLESSQLEASQSEERVSRSIMDDPFIKERFERKRQLFLLKKNRQVAGEQDSQVVISPTMTSTNMSNKAA